MLISWFIASALLAANNLQASYTAICFSPVADWGVSWIKQEGVTALPRDQQASPPFHHLFGVILTPWGSQTGQNSAQNSGAPSSSCCLVTVSSQKSLMLHDLWFPLVPWGSYMEYLCVWNKYIDYENVMPITYEELKEVQSVLYHVIM